MSAVLSRERGRGQGGRAASALWPSRRALRRRPLWPRGTRCAPGSAVSTWCNDVGWFPHLAGGGGREQSVCARWSECRCWWAGRGEFCGYHRVEGAGVGGCAQAGSFLRAGACPVACPRRDESPPPCPVVDPRGARPSTVNAAGGMASVSARTTPCRWLGSNERARDPRAQAEWMGRVIRISHAK